MAVQIFGAGFIIMMFCITSSILLAFVGGTVIDTLTMGSTGETLLNNSGVAPEWKTAQYNTMWIFINIYYFICYCLPVLGIAIFIQSMLPKTTGDRYV